MTTTKWLRSFCACAAICLGIFIAGRPCLGQGGQGNGGFLGGNGGNGGNSGGTGLNGNSGGAAQADFDTLIELITATIAPDSWEDVGGTGTLQGFPGGVFVDASGTMRRIDSRIRHGLSKRFATANLIDAKNYNDDAFESSSFRKVSLNRLERKLSQLGEGQHPSDDMLYLAGLERIDYLLIDEENRDVIIAGPAGKWMTDAEGRIVSAKTRRPVLQLDDLIVVLRNVFEGQGTFSCSITPTKENLQRTHIYIDETTQRPLKRGERARWVDGLQNALGNQEIELAGVPASCRLARTIVEADYHMKLIGIGLEPGTPGVVSYLDSIEIPKGGTAPPLGVLRWWFTLNDKAIATNAERNIFSLKQNLVEVLSENELLTKLGERIHTGQSEALNREFAASFTQHFDALAKRYPVYADLENIFELALVAAIIKHDDLFSKLDLTMDYFLSSEGYELQSARIPREVPTVANHRVIHGKHVVAAVSGGVKVDSTSWLKNHTKTKRFKSHDFSSDSKNGEASPWWWD